MFIRVWNGVWLKRVAPQNPTIMNLQKLSDSTEHTLIQERVTGWPIDTAWCCLYQNEA